MYFYVLVNNISASLLHRSLFGVAGDVDDNEITLGELEGLVTNLAQQERIITLNQSVILSEHIARLHGYTRDTLYANTNRNRTPWYNIVDVEVEVEDREQEDQEDQEGGSVELATILSLMTVKELLELAREYQLKGRSAMNKNALINALMNMLP